MCPKVALRNLCTSKWQHTQHIYLKVAAHTAYCPQSGSTHCSYLKVAAHTAYLPKSGSTHCIFTYKWQHTLHFDLKVAAHTTYLPQSGSTHCIFTSKWQHTLHIDFTVATQHTLHSHHNSKVIESPANQCRCHFTWRSLHLTTPLYQVRIALSYNVILDFPSFLCSIEWRILYRE